MAVSEDLELNLSAALSSVDELGAALDARIQEASTSLATGLADAAAAPLEVNVDAAAIGGEVGDALAGASADPLEIDVDTSTVTDEIDGAIQAATPIVAVDADTAPLVAELDAATTSTTATIQVEADTGGAEAAIAGLQDQVDALGASAGAAGGEGGGVDKLEKSASGLGAAAGLAAGETAGLGEAAGSIHPAAAIAVGSVAALAGVTADFTHEAIDAQSATLRLNNTFGDSADAVQHIDVGSLNTDLSTLGAQLGDTEANLQSAAARLGTFANASGQGVEKSAEFTSQVQALGAAAVAKNPSLGNLSDVTDRLSTALSRGGRFVSQYGIALNAKQIADEAQIETGKQSADQLTVQEKSFAGATLAVQKYGDTLDQSVAQGSQNPIIQLQALKTQLTEVATTLGQPLVAPVFDLLKAAQPIFIDVATVFGRIASVIVPVVTTLVSALVPAFDALVPAILAAVSAMGPGLATAAQSFAQAVQNVLPAITELTPTIIGLGGSLGALAVILAEPVRLFSLLVPGLVKAAEVMTPFLALITLAGGSTDKAASSASAYNLALFGQAVTIEDTAGKLNDLNASATKYLTTSSEFAKTGQTAGLLKVGESLDVVNTQLNAGTKGIEQFTAAGIKAGQIKLTLDGVDQSADDVGKLNGQLTGLLANGRAQITQGEQLVGAFANENQQRELAAQQQLDILVSGGQLTQQQRDEAVARSVATNGLGSYVQALTFATQTETEAADASQSATDTLEARAIAQQHVSEGLAALAQQALGAGVTDDDLKKKATELGVSYDKLKGFVDAVTGAYQSFKDSLVANLPGIQDVLAKVGDAIAQGSNPQKLIDQLNQSTEALVEFQANTQFLIDNNFTALATVAAQKGPEFTNALVQSIKVGRAGLGAELNNNVQVYVDNLNKTKDFLTNTAAPQLFDANTVAGQEATKAFGQSLDYSGQVTLGIGAVPGATAAAQPGVNAASAAAGQEATDSFGGALTPGTEIDQQFKLAQGNLVAVGLAGAPLLNASGEAGFNVSVAFGKGIAIGLQAQADSPGGGDIGKAARALVDMVDREVRAQAGISSPSTLAIGWGEQIGPGFAIGISAGTGNVTAAGIELVQALEASTVPRITELVNGLSETQFQFNDASFITTFGNQIDEANSAVFGQAAAFVDATRQSDAYTSSVTAATAATQGLVAATSGLRGPNDGLFAAPRTTQFDQFDRFAAQRTVDPTGIGSTRAVTIGDIHVTVPPGTTDPQAFGGQVAKGIMDNLPVEAFIS